ncbi:MAG TPA: hypothetical protein VFY56_12995, partial [Propionibacteriaceae bacterium]|nr:hypothetical protein [Propionibacteriaceae bacterium]
RPFRHRTSCGLSFSKAFQAQGAHRLRHTGLKRTRVLFIWRIARRRAEEERGDMVFRPRATTK